MARIFKSSTPSFAFFIALLCAFSLPLTVNAQMSDQELIELTIQYFEEDYEALESMAMEFTPAQSLVVTRGFLQSIPKNATDLHLPFPTLETLPEELKAFPELINLSVLANSMSDVTVLEDMDQLEWLSLTGARITSLAPIGPKPNLRNLYLEHSMVSNWDGVENFPQLRYFVAHHSQLSGAAPLWHLPHLTRLDLGQTNVTALEFSVGEECALEHLDIDDTPVDSLSNIDQCQSLERVNAANIMVTSLEPFSGLGGLLHLNLPGAAVERMGSVEGLENLTWLDLVDTKIQSLEGVEAMPNLDALYLYGSEVGDLTPVLALQNLRHLGISKTPAENSPLRPKFEARGTKIR